MKRKRLAIAAVIMITAIVSGVAALAANQPTRGADTALRGEDTAIRGADIPVCQSALPKSPTHQAKQAEPDNAALPVVRFATITISIDPKGTPLAAYQFEITADHAFTVVGLDNAGHPSFSDPPHYDRSADATDRLIVADYSTNPIGQLIAKPYNVAVIHAAFELPGDADLDAIADAIELTLTAAADTDGNAIDADITFNLHFAQRQEAE